VGFDLGTIAGKIIIDGSQAKSGFGVAEAAANAFYGAVTAKLDSVKELGTRLTALGTAGTGGLGLAVRAAANFEQTLSGVKAVSGATTKEMDNLRAMALRIGKDTSFSAGEAAQAIQELSKAGVSTTDILGGAADATVSLAAAGEIDLPRAAEIASAAMNNFAIKGSELPHVADLIAGAANASAIDVGDFGFSLTQAGAVAHLTGLSFDDLSVAIAEMGQAGIKGSDAGTSIKTFLTNLQPTTAAQTSLFRELGLITLRTSDASVVLAKHGIKPLGNSFGQVQKALQSYTAAHKGGAEGTAKNAKAAAELGNKLGVTGNAFFDAQGKMKKFSDVQDILKTATAGMTKEQKLATLNTLFGSDAIRAAAVFADQGAAGYDKMSTAIGKVGASDVAKTRLDNLNGSIENLKGSFETAQITIGEVFLPVVRKIVDVINSVVNVFNNLPPGVQKTIAIMIGLGSAFSLATGLGIKLAFMLGPMLVRFLGFRALGSIFGIFRTGFGIWRSGAGLAATLAGSIGRAGVIFSRFASIGRTLFTVLSAFPRLLAVLRVASSVAFGPWGIAIALLVAAAVLAFNKFKPFHDLVINLGNFLKGAVSQGITAIGTAIGHIVDGFQNGSTSATGFVGFLEKLGVIARVIVALALNVANVFMTSVVPALQQAGGDILNRLISAWQILSAAFRDQIMPALAQLGAAFVQLLPHLQELWVALQPVLKVLGILALVLAGAVVLEIFALARAILFLLPFVIQLISQGIQVLIVVLTATIAVIIAVVSAIISFATAIVGAMGPVVSAIAGVVTGIVNVIRGMVNLVVGILTGDWAQAWKGVVQIVTGISTALGSLLNGMKTLILGIIKGLIDGIVAFFKSLFNTLVGHSIVPEMVAAIVASIASLPGKCVAAISSLVSKIVAIFKSVFTGAVNAVKTGITTIMSSVNTIKGKVVGAFSGAVGWLASAGKAIIGGLVSGIQSRIGEVKSTLSNLTSLIPKLKGPLPVDRKLLTENGEAIINGLVTGFNNQFPDVERALASLTRSIPQQVTVAQTLQKNSSIPSPIQQAQANAQQGVTVNNNWKVFNPIAEKTSVTTTRDATRRAQLGVLG